MSYLGAEPAKQMPEVGTNTVETQDIKDGAVTATKLAAGAAVPSQTSQAGKFLTTDGSTASWATVDALPAQTSQSGKYLTTNGTAASWGTITAPTATAVSDTANTSTGYFKLPNGTTAQRPASPNVGMIRYNSDLGTNESYTTAGWIIFPDLTSVINSVSGGIYNTVPTTLTLNGSNFGGSAGTVNFVSGVTTASVSITPSSSNTMSVAVPSTIYALGSGVQVLVSFTNYLGRTSNAVTLTVASMPTGGTISISGGYRYHTFNSSATFSVTSGTIRC